MKTLYYQLARISLYWGIFINVAVALNLSFALPVAAGGQYQNFPVGIRILYLFQTFLLLYEFKILNRLNNGQNVKPKWIVNFFIILGGIGILLNVISKSAFERWNVLPLVLITYAFWKLNKKSALV